MARNERGFTLVETAVALTLSIVLLYTLHATLRSSIGARQATEQEHRVMRIAADYVARLRDVPFGNAMQPAASGAQLDELFDDDLDLGTVTLLQLRSAPHLPGHTFAMSSAGVTGRWRVRVTSDLDGDGSMTGAREGRDDIVRIEVYFDDRLMFTTMRAHEPANTTKDVGVVY